MTRQPRHGAHARTAMPRTLLAIVALLLLVAACGDSTEVATEPADADAGVGPEEPQDAAAAEEEESDAGFHSTGAWIGGYDKLPDEFPQEFPLPDDYEIVSNASVKEDAGLVLTLRLAVPGSEEEQVAFYEEFVHAEFQDVEVADHGTSFGWTFDKGLGFERGFVDVSENHGEGGTDSSEFPVMLFIELSEQASSE